MTHTQTKPGDGDFDQHDDDEAPGHDPELPFTCTSANTFIPHHLFAERRHPSASVETDERDHPITETAKRKCWSQEQEHLACPNRPSFFTDTCTEQSVDWDGMPSAIPMTTSALHTSTSAPASPRPLGSVQCSDHPPPTTRMDLSTKHARSFSSPIVLDLSAHYVPQDGEDVLMSSSSSSSSLSHDTPPRTLRRKRRMSYLRATFTAHVHDNNLSSESCPNIINQPMLEPSMRHFATDEQGRPIARLGHPSRPYYNAIRKNMSRCATPFDESSRPITSSEFMRSTPTMLLDNTSVSDHGNKVPRWTPSRLRLGFSVSGETEMRMALAARRRGRGSFVFVERRKGRWLSRLGRGIKRFVLGYY